MTSVRGIRVRINNTPREDASGAVPESQNSHNRTANTSFSLLASMRGIENDRKLCTATQTQPAEKAGNKRGSVMANKVRIGVAPHTYAACSSSLWIWIMALFMMRVPKEI